MFYTCQTATILNFSRHCIKNGMQSTFSIPGVPVTKEGNGCASGSLSEILYELDRKVSSNRAVACTPDINCCYERLTQVFHNVIKQMCNENEVTSTQMSSSDVRKPAFVLQLEKYPDPTFPNAHYNQTVTFWILYTAISGAQ